MPWLKVYVSYKKEEDHDMIFWSYYAILRKYFDDRVNKLQQYSYQITVGQRYPWYNSYRLLEYLCLVKTTLKLEGDIK